MTTETFESFKKRVLDSTGMNIEDIPAGDDLDLLDGQILCRRGNIYVVTDGAPIIDEDGNETFDSFKVVVL